MHFKAKKIWSFSFFNLTVKNSIKGSKLPERIFLSCIEKDYFLNKTMNVNVTLSCYFSKRNSERAKK